MAEISIIYYSHGNDKIINGLVERWLLMDKRSGETAGVGDVKGMYGDDGDGVNSPPYEASPMTLTDPIIN